MRAAPNYHYDRCDILHNGELLGVVRSGGVEEISDARSDEPFFWFGWHALVRGLKAAAPAVPARPSWYQAAMQDSIRRSACAAAVSSSTG